MKLMALIAAIVCTLNAHSGIFVSRIGYTEENNVNIPFFAAGAVMMGAGLVMFPNFKVLAVALVILDEEVNANELSAGLQKSFPEINDLSLVDELAELAMLKADSNFIQLDPQDVTAILERSDLSTAQINRIATILK